MEEGKLTNNRGKIIQLQKETAYLPPSCSLLRESSAAASKKITLSRQSAWSAFQHDRAIHDLTRTEINRISQYLIERLLHFPATPL